MKIPRTIALLSGPLVVALSGLVSARPLFQLEVAAAAAVADEGAAPAVGSERTVEPVGNPAVVERIVAIGRDESRVQDHLRLLTRRYGPRLTGSPLIYQAQLWAERTFESFGLDAHLEQWGEFPVGFWRGPASGRVIAPEARELTFITSAWSPGTIGPVRGRALLAPQTEEELEALRPQLAGAYVLRARAERGGGRRSRGEGDGAPAAGDARGGDAQPRAGQLGEAQPNDAQAGEARGGEPPESGVNAAAAPSSGFFSEQDDAEQRRRARELAEAFDAACAEAKIAGVIRPGPSDGRLVTSGNHRVDPEKLPSELSITLDAKQFEELSAWIKSGVAVELEFDVDNRFTPGPVANYNVVADLVGSELPDEYVVVQAHIDAWDGAEGACDNGTGVATTLEAARILSLADARPRRTIRFILYSGEEQGLLGSRAYVEAHKDDLPRTSIVLNHDEGTNHLKGIQATEAMQADFERVFAPVQALDESRPFEILKVDGLRGFGSSDHASFIAAGVPGFHWIQDGNGYSHIHHTQYDTFDAAIPDEQRHSALVVALAAYGFAELERLVDRTRMAAPPQRRMGVMLEGTTVSRVTPRAKAEAAGWKEGDVVVSIDGVEIATRDAIVAELQKGGPVKKVVLRRGTETVETTLDYSDEPGEAERARNAEGAGAAGSGPAPPSEGG